MPSSEQAQLGGAFDLNQSSPQLPPNPKQIIGTSSRNGQFVNKFILHDLLIRFVNTICEHDLLKLAHVTQPKEDDLTQKLETN